MKIGGFQPLTLTDYPGHLAAIVFTQGCNFRCPFCHNSNLLASIVSSRSTLDQCVVLETLEARRKLLDGVVVTGGEPTLQSDVAEFAERVKHKQLKVKLDTNGSRPAVLDLLLNRNLLDYVAMDIKAPFDKYARLAGVNVSTEAIRESIALLIASDIAFEFRTTFVPSLLTQADIDEIRSHLPESAPYTLQPFVAEHALDQSLRPQACRDSTVEPPPSMQPGHGTATADLPYHIDLLSGE